MTNSMFLNNLLLTIIWVLATGTLTEENFIFGFLISFGILYIITINKEERKYFTILPKLISFIMFMSWEILKANLVTVKESLYAKSKLEPAVIKVPLTVESDIGITILATMVSVTPGTLVMDISDDKKVMYVHVMHVRSKKEFVDEVKNKFEKRLLEILR
ncbi:Na+/H+ antiporter subunit E [Aquiflexum lacus]|uniref:Na+/H+ antiporter subunit E n=1 Tax=Aquiflexum lacus TaxID=2483805 RepID=UPI0018936416|nr:Na+/H+ antiporter subunit E [Aquiflexum lacus]